MKLPTSKSLAQLGLGVATVVIVVMGWTLYSATHSAFEASEQLGRTHDVLRAIDNTDFNFARGESVHRLFLLTGNDAYLNERDAFLSQARRFAMRLAELTADNPTQQGRAQALIPLIDERHRIMDEFVQLRRAAGVEAAGKRMVGIGQTVGNKMHALTEEIAKNEDAQLDERHNESERRHDFTLLVLVSTLILAVVVVTPAYAGFISQARARDRAERLLMEVTAGLPGVVYRLRTSRDGLRHVEYLSEGVEALWGIDRATALGDFKALAHYTIEVDRSRVAAEMEKAERQLGPVQIEFRVDAPRDAENDTLNLALNSTNSRANYLIPGQKNKWIHASAIVSREDDGSIIWNGYWSDITQQKMIDERLIAAEKLLVEVTNGVPGVIAQFRSHRNGEMEFAFLSLGIEPLLGLDRASIMNNFKLAFRQVIPEYLEPLRATFLAAAKAGIPWQHEYQALHRDGRIRWLSTSAVPDRDANGAVVWNAYSSDITERKLLEHALHDAREASEAATRAKGTFLATMSHEIRTPMTGVLGLLELLRLTKLDAAQRDTLEIIGRSSKALLRIIDDILDFSKIEAGKLDVNATVSSIGEIIRHVFSIYSGNASAKGLLLKSHTDPAISPALMVDAVRVQQVLNNLVSNAIKFTAAGAVTLRADFAGREDGKEVIRLSVQDTGIGISTEDQALLFQPFMQAERTTTRHFGGTGLGLSICRRLATLMGGTIAMESTPDVGTTVTLTLPMTIADPNDLNNTSQAENKSLLALEQTIAARRVAPDIASAIAEGTLILLVDDHPINVMVMMRQLNSLGYASESAENGVVALQKWQTGNFALLLTDCNMPEMDGFELTRNIRKAESERGLKRVPIIASTANAMEGEDKLCVAAGMDAHLVKPVDIRVLMDTLDKWLPIAETAEVVLDRFVLGTISRGKAEVERELIALFRKVNDEDTQALQASVAASDMPGTAHVAHRIAGAAKMIGAKALAVVASRLEVSSRANDNTAVLGEMLRFTREVARVYSFFDTIRHSRAGDASIT